MLVQNKMAPVFSIFLRDLNCFSDIDECATGTHSCSDHAVCNNTKGGHNCTCKKGFIGDGVNCTGNTFAFALVMPETAVFLFL